MEGMARCVICRRGFSLVSRFNATFLSSASKFSNDFPDLFCPLYAMLSYILSFILVITRFYCIILLET